MARGNWQRRVELNESRRNEAKQKKHRNEEKKTFKSQVQGLISFLDLHTDALGQAEHRMVHIWTDTIPSDAPPVLDLWEEETARHSKRGGRGRSISIESEKAARTPASSGKKKAHPRSKDATTVETEEEATHAPKLCRSYFFSGKCESSKKGGGKKGQGGSCRYVHYPKKYNSLADILLLNPTPNGDSSIGREAAALSEASYPESHPGGESTTHLDAMDMVYYLSLNLKEFSVLTEGSSKADVEAVRSLGEWVVDAMASRACSTGSIVYLMIDNQLLYDRYRDGVDLNEAALVGSVAQYSDTSTRIEKLSPNEDHVVLLPAPVLEYVLTFLEDPAVASMSMVCSSWNQEIGKQSSNLWSFLLNRRSWPIPEVTGGNDRDDTLPTLREAFISHYVAVRDMNAIKAGIHRLLSSTSAARSKASLNDREGCYRSFDSLRGAPQEQNPCIALKVWSPNRVLAAYYQDCTLRLFDSVQRSGGCGQRLCREIVCLRIDPYKKTRKRACQMISLALDDECIGCLLHVVEDSSGSEAFVLAVLSREDFLMDSDTTLADGTQVIDIGQSVLNFLVSCDEVDHGLLQLHDFLSEDGNLDDVEVLVSQSIASCGFGRFMVEVSVSVPLGSDEDDSDANVTLLFRKLFIFSASVGAIVWMCDSNPSSVPLRPRHEHFTLVSVKTDIDGRYGCNIAALASFGAGIMFVSINSTGNVSTPTMVQGSALARDDILLGSWRMRRSQNLPLVVVGNEIYAADNLVHENENGTKTYQSFLSCYPIADATEPLFEKFQLRGNLEVCHLTSLRKDHILAICRVFGTNPSATEVDEVDGQWFGGGDSASNVSSYAIIIDIPSRVEIHRLLIVEDLVAHLGHDLASDGELPIQLAAFGDTVAAGLWWKGITMTGTDVRRDLLSERGDHEAAYESSAKKKKKQPPKKSGKKDGFARGMSLRG